MQCWDFLLIKYDHLKRSGFISRNCNSVSSGTLKVVSSDHTNSLKQWYPNHLAPWAGRVMQSWSVGWIQSMVLVCRSDLEKSCIIYESGPWGWNLVLTMLIVVPSAVTAATPPITKLLALGPDEWFSSMLQIQPVGLVMGLDICHQDEWW